MSFEDPSPSTQADEHSSAVPSNHSGDAEADRLHQRFPFNGTLHLCWEERRGERRRIRAHAIDKSKFGILVEAERPITTGTLVSVEASNFAVLGRASVRHCTPKGVNYRIGLYMPDRLVQDL